MRMNVLLQACMFGEKLSVVGIEEGSISWVKNLCIQASSYDLIKNYSNSSDLNT